MYQHIKRFAFAAAFAVIGTVGYLAIPAEAEASCSGPCAPITITCANGNTIRGPAAQANLLQASCGNGGGNSYMAEKPMKRVIVKEWKQQQPVHKRKVISTERAVERVKANIGGGKWIKPKPGYCAVGQPAPAFQDAALAAVGMTLTCDSQPGTGGWNFKPLGSSKPAYFQRCVLRLNGTGFTKACKTALYGYRLEGNSLVLNTNKGILVYSKGAFGGGIKRY